MIILFFLFILGLAVGSFLNVLIDRWSHEEGIAGRSHCDHCKKTLSWQDLVPVLSYLALGGKCRYCKKKISFYYPLVEIVTAAAFILVLHPWGGRMDSPGVEFVSSLGIISSLIVIFFADLKYHIIPDEATVALILFSMPTVLMSGQWQVHFIAGLATMLTIYFPYYLSRGRAMGFGDVKLAFAMGLLLGIQGGLLAVYLSFVFGGIAGAALLLTGKKGLKSKIAFGPFLVLGTVLVWLFKTELMMLIEQYFYMLK